MTDRDVGAALRIQQAIDKYAVKHGCAPARLLVGSAVWDEAMTEMKYHPSLVKEATFAGIPIVNWGGYIHKDWIVIEPTKEYKVIGNLYENPDLWRHRHSCRRIYQYDPDYKPFDMKEAREGLKQYAEQVRKDFMQESITIFGQLHNACKSKGPIR